MIFFTLALVALPLFSTQAEEQQPKDKLQCWTKTACTVDFDKNGVADGRWDNKTAEAIKACKGAEYGYCYAQPSPLDLNVAIPIGENTYKTSVTDFGDYINTFYNYLIGVSALIAVVMVMVAGAQYVAASGSGDVGKAKERIRNAVTGFVLLMFAVLLLETVNPQLRKLEVPPIPKIRQVLIYAEDTTCEYYIEKGFEVENVGDDFALEEGKPLCEDPDSKVLKDPQDQELTDVTCKWSWCGGEEVAHPSGVSFPKVCMEISGKPKCVACQEVTTGPPFATATPSSGVCAVLSPENKEGRMQHAWCKYTKDEGFEPSEFVDSATNGQCAAVAFDCSTITSCANYGTVLAQNEDGTQWLFDLEDDQSLGEYTYYKEICEANYCKDQIKADCQFTEYGSARTCLNK